MGHCDFEKGSQNQRFQSTPLVGREVFTKRATYSLYALDNVDNYRQLWTTPNHAWEPPSSSRRNHHILAYFLHLSHCGHIDCILAGCGQFVHTFGHLLTQVVVKRWWPGHGACDSDTSLTVECQVYRNIWNVQERFKKLYLMSVCIQKH